MPCRVPAPSRPLAGMSGEAKGGTPVKVAEALALRADATRRVKQLRCRIVANAHYLERKEPTEDTHTLLTEAVTAVDELGVLIRRINRTNASSPWMPVHAH